MSLPIPLAASSTLPALGAALASPAAPVVVVGAVLLTGVAVLVTVQRPPRALSRLVPPLSLIFRRITMALPIPAATAAQLLTRLALSANPASALAAGAALLFAGIAYKIAVQDAPVKRVRLGDLDAEFGDDDRFR